MQFHHIYKQLGASSQKKNIFDIIRRNKNYSSKIIIKRKKQGKQHKSE